MNEQQTAAMRQALEALESCTPGDYLTGHVIDPSYDEKAVEQAITVLRQALEQKPSGIKQVIELYDSPEQQPADEPVAFRDWYDNAIWGNEDFQAGCERAWNAALEHTRPQPAADIYNATSDDRLMKMPADEPVAWGNLANWCLDSDRVLITDKAEAEKYHRDVYDLTPLYTHPQPLTGGDDRRHIICLCPDCTRTQPAAAIPEGWEQEREKLMTQIGVLRSQLLGMRMEFGEGSTMSNLSAALAAEEAMNIAVAPKLREKNT